MSETAGTREKTRKVKNHILDIFLHLATKVDIGEELSPKQEKTYNELLACFAKNVVPRSTEISGEDGQSIKIVFDSAFNGTPPTPETNSTDTLSI